MRQPRLTMLLLCTCTALAAAACGPETPGPADPEAPAGAGAPATPDAAVDADTDAAPATDAGAGLVAALGAFEDVRSYHATMTIEAQGTTMRRELDFVAPDRFRMTMAGGLGTQTIIGDTMYIQADGQVMRSKVPAGMLDNLRNPGRMEDAGDGTVVQALGPAMLDGRPARRFLLSKSAADVPTEVTIWVGADGLPLQVRAVTTGQGEAGSSLIRYSRYNDPSITITPPQ